MFCKGESIPANTRWRGCGCGGAEGICGKLPFRTTETLAGSAARFERR